MLMAGNIEALMKRRKMSAPRLAEKAKLNPAGIYDIMSGKSKNPRLDTISKIAGALKVPVAVLLEEPDEREFRLQLVEVFSRLPEGERERLLVTARAWLNAPD